MRVALSLVLAAFGLNAQTAPTWVTSSPLPVAVRGTTYSVTLAATGGTAPRTFSLVTGALPAGLSLLPAGGISGTPTTTGITSFTLRVTDSAQRTADRSFSLTVSAPGLTLATSALPPAGACGSYSYTMAASGGTPPFTWSANGLPSGFSIGSSTGTITGSGGTPGNYTVTISARDSGVQSVARSYVLSISGASLPAITTSALPSGRIGQAYTAALTAAGGTAPYTFAVADTPVPGLALLTSGAITGTPTAEGNYATLYRVTDSASCSATARLTTQIAAAVSQVPSLTITTTGLAAARADLAYTQLLEASGGTPPYTWSLAAGGLPEGYELSTDGAIAGLTSVKGAYPLLLRVTDSEQRTAIRQYTLIVNGGMTIDSMTLPPGRLGAQYSFQLLASGGLGGLTWSVSNGTLPTGMQLNLFSGILSGTPFAAGDFSFEVTLKDADNFVVTKAFTLTIGDVLAITTDRLPSGKISIPYTASVTATGGVPPLEFEATGLPPGLTMDPAGAITGTPTTSGAWAIAVKVTDSTKGQVIKSVVLTVDTVFRILTETLQSGQAGSPYGDVLTAVDGKPPYRWSVPPRSLPIGVNLNEITGEIQGTPVEPGDYSITFRATDAVNATAEKTLVLNIRNGFRITTDTLPPANINVAYSATLQTAGARTPVAWSIKGGEMPPGLTLDPASGTITGRAATLGEFAFTIRATDAIFLEATRDLKITVRDVLRLTPATLPTADVNAAYQQKISALDAQGALTWSLLSGIVPDGLRLEFSPDGATLTGTPTKAGSFQFVLQVRDTAGQTATQTLTVRVIAPVSILTGTLRNAFAAVAYTEQLTVEGGEPPYQWSVASGLLPAGLQLDPIRGIISGSPTQAGTLSFTIEVTDAAQRKTQKQLSIRVIRDLTPVQESLSAATVGLRYTQQVRTVISEVSWSVSEGRLPDGLSLDTSSGEIAGIPTREGTFNFTLTALDTSGATGSRPYTIAVARLELPRFTIDPAAVSPGRQTPLSITLSAAAPSDLTGTLTVQFQSEVGAADPAVRLASGRTVSFTVPRGAFRAVFPKGADQLQSGTIAGTITLTAALFSNGVAVTPDPTPVRTIRVPRSAPVITSLTARRLGAAINVEITGFATSREVSAAEFQFPGAAPTTISLQSLTAEWFRSASAQQYGSLFTVTIPFLSNPAPSVTVTLVNSLGKSEPKTVPIR